MYKTCYIEQLSDKKWYIMWPDCTKAWYVGFKTRNWATRTLIWLCNSNN